MACVSNLGVKSFYGCQSLMVCSSRTLCDDESYENLRV